MKFKRLIMLPFVLTILLVCFTALGSPDDIFSFNLDYLDKLPNENGEKIKLPVFFLETSGLENEVDDKLKLVGISLASVSLPIFRGFFLLDQTGFIQRNESFDNPPRSPPIVTP